MEHRLRAALSPKAALVPEFPQGRGCATTPSSAPWAQFQIHVLSKWSIRLLGLTYSHDKCEAHRPFSFTDSLPSWRVSKSGLCTRICTRLPDRRPEPASLLKSPRHRLQHWSPIWSLEPPRSREISLPLGRVNWWQLSCRPGRLVHYLSHS